MRQLYPVDRDDVDALACYEDPRRRKRRDRPYVFVNMVASVDGATVVEGVTEQLGGPADRHVFMLLRSLADGILVGAGTVRKEGYGPPRVREEFAAARAARGQEALPRIVVVSRSLDLDWSSRLFTDDRTRPCVVCPAGAEAARLAQASAVADVVAVGDREVDLAAALEQLVGKGVRALLCEGGPTLNAALLAAGLVDELCLTVSPTLVGAGGGDRIMGSALVGTTPLQLAHVLEDDGYLFLRYLVGPVGRS